MIKRHTFENGFQLVYQKSTQSIPLTSVHVLCNVGSAYEIDPIRGASHLVEHMCFKGTKEHGKARTMLLEYNKVGAYINAYTEKRVTGYTLMCDDAHAAKCINVLSDMILQASFSKKEFDKEQHVVVEENIRTKDNHEYMLRKALDKIYFCGSSYEHPIDILSYHPTPTHLKYEDIYQWYKWFYRPANMVCSVVSNMSFTEICRIIKTSVFMKTDTLSTASVYMYPKLVLYPINKHFIYHKKLNSALILHVGFRTCSYYDDDKYLVKVLQHILNGFSGRLFTTFRTKRGLTYHSSAHSTFHEHMGYFNFFIQTDPSKLITDGKGKPGIIPTLLDLIEDLIKNGITSEELVVAKGNCKGKQLIKLQDIDSIAEYNGLQVILKQTDVPFQQMFDKHIAPITCHQVNTMIRKYITYKNLVVGIVHKDTIPKNKIESLFHEAKW